MRIFLTIFFLITASASRSQMAQLQLIHCSADSGLKIVDVWIDTVKVLDDFSFKQSSHFLNVSSFSISEISVCPKNSLDTTNAYLRTQLIFQNNSKNIGFLNGQPSVGYSPSSPTSIAFKTNILSEIVQPENTAILVYQGTSDLLTTDFKEITLFDDFLAEGISYNEVTNYTTLESLNYRMQLSDSANSEVYRLIELKLLSLGFADSAITLISAGFNVPTNNANGPSLNLYISPPSGGDWIPLPISKSKIQVINNSLDPILSESDIYLGGSLLISDLGFRSATSYLEIPAGLSQPLSIAAGSSQTIDDTLFSQLMTLEANKNYVYVLNGLANQNSNNFKPLSWSAFQSRSNANLGYNTDINLVHGALDAGALNIDVVSPTDFPIFSNINYSESSGYEEIPSAPYSFQLRASDDSQIFRKYAVDLSLSQAIGEAQTWIISGLADTLFADSNSQIGIWVATNSGGPLKELSTITGMDEIAFPTFHLFPNPASQSIQLSNSSNESIRILSMDGRVMMESSRSLQQIDVSTWPNGVYIVIVESKSSRQTQRITVIH